MDNYNPGVIKILEDWLERNGYDGLYQSGVCACEIGELCPCGEPCPDCHAGYKGPGQDGYDFMIGPEKPNKEARMKAVDLTGKLEPEDVPLCPICDNPIEYTLYAVGFVRHEYGESHCLICLDCAEEKEAE